MNDGDDFLWWCGGFSLANIQQLSTANFWLLIDRHMVASQRLIDIDFSTFSVVVRLVYWMVSVWVWLTLAELVSLDWHFSEEIFLVCGTEVERLEIIIDDARCLPKVIFEVIKCSWCLENNEKWPLNAVEWHWGDAIITPQKPKICHKHAIKVLWTPKLVVTARYTHHQTTIKLL